MDDNTTNDSGDNVIDFPRPAIMPPEDAEIAELFAEILADQDRQEAKYEALQRPIDVRVTLVSPPQPAFPAAAWLLWLGLCLLAGIGLGSVIGL